MSQIGSNLGQQIEDLAEGPRRVTGDEGSVEMHSIPDLIAADEYLAKKSAGAKPLSRMVRRAVMVPPGTRGTANGVSQ